MPSKVVVIFILLQLQHVTPILTLKMGLFLRWNQLCSLMELRQIILAVMVASSREADLCDV